MIEITIIRKEIGEIIMMIITHLEDIVIKNGNQDLLLHIGKTIDHQSSYNVL